MKTSNYKDNILQSGYALLLVVVILSSLMILTLTFARTFLNEIQTTTETRRSIQAIYTADTGIERALFDLYHGSKNENFSENNVIYTNSPNQYQVITQRKEDMLSIHAYGTSQNILRELEIQTPVTLSVIKKEMEDDIFSTLADDSCNLLTTCLHSDVILDGTTANNSCHRRTYYTDESYDPENLYFFQQENPAYGDCQIGDGLAVGTITLKHNLTPGTPYYFAYRSFHTAQDNNENIIVSTSSGQGPFISTEASFTNQENGFFDCIFSTPISFDASNEHLILQNTTANTPIIIDWYAFYKKIPEGIVSCD